MVYKIKPMLRETKRNENFIRNLSMSVVNALPMATHLICKFAFIFCFVVINLRYLENAQLAERTSIQLTNGEQRFSCPLCKSVKYTQVRYLKTHIKDCGRIFLCHICKLSYKQKRTFMQHMRSKHPSVTYQS